MTMDAVTIQMTATAAKRYGVRLDRDNTVRLASVPQRDLPKRFTRQMLLACPVSGGTLVLTTQALYVARGSIRALYRHWLRYGVAFTPLLAAIDQRMRADARLQGKVPKQLHRAINLPSWFFYPMNGADNQNAVWLAVTQADQVVWTSKYYQQRLYVPHHGGVTITYRFTPLQNGRTVRRMLEWELMRHLSLRAVYANSETPLGYELPPLGMAMRNHLVMPVTWSESDQWQAVAQVLFSRLEGILADFLEYYEIREVQARFQEQFQLTL